MGLSASSDASLGRDGQPVSGWMLLVGVMVVVAVLKDALGRMTEHPVVVGAKGISRTEIVFGVVVVLRMFERLGEAALGIRPTDG